MVIEFDITNIEAHEVQERYETTIGEYLGSIAYSAFNLINVNKGLDQTKRKVAAYDPNTKKMTKEQLSWPKS